MSERQRNLISCRMHLERGAARTLKQAAHAPRRLERFDMATQAERLINAHIDGAFRYHVQIDPNSDSAHARMLRIVGNNKRVLELGCAGGHMTAVLRSRGCEITAVEIDDRAADAA